MPYPFWPQAGDFCSCGEVAESEAGCCVDCADDWNPNYRNDVREREGRNAALLRALRETKRMGWDPIALGA